MKKQDQLNYLIITVFILFISLPAIFGILLPKRTNSLIENRRLAELVETPKDWQQVKIFPNAFDKYYADHFGFRWSLLFLYRHLKYFIHDSPTNISFFGKEQGWIFYNRKNDGDNIGSYRNINQFTHKQLKLFIDRIKQKQKWLSRQGIEYLFVIAPSKQYIYPEYLPDYIKPINRENIVQQLTKELLLHPEINFIDLTPVLIKYKKDQLLYFKADSHWNFFGTNIAQFIIAEKLTKLFPNKLLPKLFPYSIFNEQEFQGGLARYMGLGEYFKEQNFVPALDDCATSYTPKDKVFKQIFTTQCQQGKLSALVFRDSFFTSLQPFMSLYFQQATFIWEKMTFATAKKMISKNKPNVVIEEWVDRYFPRSLPATYTYKK